MRRLTALPDHVLSFGLAACCFALALLGDVGSVAFWVLVVAAALAALYGVRELRARHISEL